MATYGEWIAYHLELFGLDEKRRMPTLEFWVAELFKPRGVSPDDLRAASLWIAQNDPPSFFEDHLPRLQRRLAEINDERSRLAERKNRLRADADAEANRAPAGTLMRLWKEARRASSN